MRLDYSLISLNSGKTIDLVFRVRKVEYDLLRAVADDPELGIRIGRRIDRSLAPHPGLDVFQANLVARPGGHCEEKKDLRGVSLPCSG